MIRYYRLHDPAIQIWPRVIFYIARKGLQKISKRINNVYPGIKYFTVLMRLSSEISLRMERRKKTIRVAIFIVLPARDKSYRSGDYVFEYTAVTALCSSSRGYSYCNEIKPRSAFQQRYEKKYFPKTNMKKKKKNKQQLIPGGWMSHCSSMVIGSVRYIEFLSLYLYATINHFANEKRL